MLTALPAGFSGVGYLDSGWCYVEAAISGIIKQRTRRLDLGLCGDLQQPNAFGAPVSYGVRAFGDTLVQRCAVGASPPLLPEDLQTALDTQKTFTNRADSHLVGQLFANFFDAVAPVAE